MDSKTQLPSSYGDDEPAPPSYTESTSNTWSSSSDASQYYSAQIRSQLSHLKTQISSLQTQKSLLAHAQDEKILSLLTTHIQAYLSDFAITGLQRGTLILVPAKGLEEENATPTDYDFRDPVEYDRVVRVSDKEESGYGEGLWFWRDEEMAERIAASLRPAPNPRTMELPPRKEELAAASQSSQDEKSSPARGFWGRMKSGTKTTESPKVEERRYVKGEGEQNLSSGRESGERIVFDIKAEEVCFRTENEFGMYGTERGYGIVLKLKVLLGGR